MTGPLAQQIAQVREAVNHSATEAHHQDAYGTRPDWYHAAHDALSVIERHVQDMETALEQVLDCKGSYNGTVSERGGEPAICMKCENVARAALSAAPTATHQETK